MNKHIHKYHDAQLDTVPVDAALRDRVQHQINTQAKVPHKRLTTWFGLLGLGTTTAVAILVLPFLMQTHSSDDQNTSLSAALAPHAALAQALTNTLNMDDFSKTFGMPASDTFQHRAVTIEYRESDYASENESFFQKRDQIDLWTLGESVRQEWQWIAHGGGDEIITTYDLIDASKKESCHAVYQETERIEHFCNDFEEIAQQKQEAFRDTVAAPTDEKLIQQISIEPFYDAFNGESVRLRWASSTPLTKHTVLTFDDGFTDVGETTVVDYKNSQEANRLNDGLYWHSMEVSRRFTNPSPVVFVQVLEHQYETPEDIFDNPITGGSELYTINFEKKTIEPITYDDVEKNIAKTSVHERLAHTMYREALEPAKYIMTHPDEFATPSDVHVDSLNGENVTAIIYPLTNSFVAQSTGMLSHTGIEFSAPDGGEVSPNFITLWINESSQTFKGYAVTDADGNVLTKTTIRDSIVTDHDPATFFTKEEWEQSLPQ